jgi:phosphonopyruvate decarboxylase
MPETLRFFLDPADFYNMLKEKNIDFYTGVPDSLLKDFCAYITDTAPKDKHVIAANEGAAIGLATGYYLATGKIPVVYMQNSGFGNAINPLLSLCDPKVSRRILSTRLQGSLDPSLTFQCFTVLLCSRSTLFPCFC